MGLKHKWIGPDGWLIQGTEYNNGDEIDQELSPEDEQFFSQLGYIELSGGDQWPN